MKALTLYEETKEGDSPPEFGLEDVLKCPISGKPIINPVLSPSKVLYDEQSVKLYLSTHGEIHENGTANPLKISDFKLLKMELLSKMSLSVSQLCRPTEKIHGCLIDEDYFSPRMTRCSEEEQQFVEQKFGQIPMCESYLECEGESDDNV
ncbi:unnamed protein product [Moneuplotes crassus]|uniref:U-box domain-containing protein n=1 Tax=Euplotes crassus TaxID=5936 RepID=A0AAD1Y0N9_EUPCR|nr:unnamed protein product [Moneuplotes crassus]